MRKILLYGYKTWPASIKSIRRLPLLTRDGSLDVWCRLEQSIRTQEIHEKPGIISVPEEIRWSRLDTLVISRDWTKISGQEKLLVMKYLEVSPEDDHNCIGVRSLQETPMTLTSKKGNYVKKNTILKSATQCDTL